MSMNQWLAKVYGTGNDSQEDLEKLAQAQMAETMAQNENLDLSGLNEEQIAELGQHVLGGSAGGAQPGAQPTPGGQPPQIDPAQLTPEIIETAQAVLANPQGFEPDAVQEAQAVMAILQQAQGQPQAQPMAKTAQERMKEAQESFQEADFLGRIMAHSFYQESQKIAADLQAQSRPQPQIAPAAPATGGAPNLAALAGAAAQPQPAVAPQAAAPDMAKLASSVNAAAEKLAAEILTANGINPQTLQPMQPQAQAQPAAAPAPNPAAQQALGTLVEKRAHQILNKLGFRVE